MKVMTQTRKPIGQDQILNDDELNAICGGAAKTESRIIQALSNAFSDVMKNFGQALQTAARG
jgi:hypothetical protein